MNTWTFALNQQKCHKFSQGVTSFVGNFGYSYHSVLVWKAWKARTYNIEITKNAKGTSHPAGK